VENAKASALKTRAITFTAALRDLSASLVINALCPYLVYQYLAPQFAAGSMIPLACSSVFPIIGLGVSLVRQRSLDFIAVLALVEVVVGLAAIAVSNTPSQALIGRSLPNAALSVIFLISILINRPIMASITRQFVAGNDAGRRARFDQVATAPDGRHVFKVVTVVWTLALLVKCGVSLWSAESLTPAHFFLVSPAFNYGMDLVLVWWGIGYGYVRLRGTIGKELPVASE
jgi:hypothetical protein